MAVKNNSMNEKDKNSNKASIAITGFVAGVITILLVLFSLNGC